MESRNWGNWGNWGLINNEIGSPGIGESWKGRRVRLRSFGLLWNLVLVVLVGEVKRIELNLKVKGFGWVWRFFLEGVAVA